MNRPVRNHVDESVLVDGALRETLALLALVQREEQVHARLDQCVTELRTIQQARATLMDRTQVELDEALLYLPSENSAHVVTQSAEEVGR